MKAWWKTQNDYNNNNNNNYTNNLYYSKKCTLWSVLMLCYKINRIGIRTAECRMQNRRIQNAEPPLAELWLKASKKKKGSRNAYIKRASKG